MTGPHLMFVFGGLLVITGIAMVLKATTARRRLNPWLGDLIIAGSSIALGTMWMLAEGDILRMASWVSPMCSLGFIAGFATSRRESKRLNGR